MGQPQKRTPVNVRLTQEERDLLDALGYLQGKSPSDLLLPPVRRFLEDNAKIPGVQLALEARQEARASGIGDASSPD